MKIRRISRRTPVVVVTDRRERPRSEVMRTAVAVTLALALIGTGAIALPSFAPMEPVKDEAPALTVAPLEPELLADIETVHESAGMLGSPLKEVAKAAKAFPAAAAKVAKATKAVTRPIADGVESIPRKFVRATAHEAIKMKRGIIPLIPSKFARAEDGVTIPVSLTQYCVQGETRRGRQTRHGIVAADPRIFPLSRYVDVFLGDEYLGRYLVDDTGGNVLGATLDIWNPDCREAARFGRHWGSATLIARAVEAVSNDSLAPTRWDGLAKR
jgi:3D (Asp-Asp-Asp) domain-containing protein